MNFLKAMPFIPTRQYHSETLDYRDRILGNGGTISVSSLDAVEKFVRDCKNSIIWDKLIEVGPFAGDNLAAALVKLKTPGASACINTNFIAADYEERGANGGLLGDGATKWLDTSFNAQSLPDAGHLSFYLREDVTAAGNRALIGALTGTDQYWLGALTPATEARFRYGGVVSALQSTSCTRGYYLGARRDLNDIALYKNGSLVQTSNTAVVHAKPNLNLVVFGFSNGGPGGFLPARGSFYSIGHALNDSEVAHLHAAVQSLQRNLGRAI